MRLSQLSQPEPSISSSLGMGAVLERDALQAATSVYDGCLAAHVTRRHEHTPRFLHTCVPDISAVPYGHALDTLARYSRTISVPRQRLVDRIRGPPGDPELISRFVALEHTLYFGWQRLMRRHMGASPAAIYAERIQSATFDSDAEIPPVETFLGILSGRTDFV